MEKTQELIQLLPGYNCKVCGFSNCHDFAVALAENKESPNKCPVLSQERFRKRKEIILESITNSKHQDKAEINGLMDGVKADFILHPLKNEPSCRETMVCFSHIDLKRICNTVCGLWAVR